MAWAALVIAGLLEVAGVALINKFNRDRKWHTLVLLMLGFACSFVCLSYAMRTLPMGLSYAVWTGIGAAGGAIAGMLFFGESTDRKRIAFIAIIILAAAGLKLVA